MNSRSKVNAKAELIFKELGTFLKDHRVKSGMSQMEVSKALGYTTSQFLSNCERGVSSLPLEKLPVLLKLYRLRKKELIEFILRAQKNYLERELEGTVVRRVSPRAQRSERALASRKAS